MLCRASQKITYINLLIAQLAITSSYLGTKSDIVFLLKGRLYMRIQLLFAAIVASFLGVIRLNPRNFSNAGRNRKIMTNLFLHVNLMH